MNHLLEFYDWCNISKLNDDLGNRDGFTTAILPITKQNFIQSFIQSNKIRSNLDSSNPRVSRTYFISPPPPPPPPLIPPYFFLKKYAFVERIRRFNTDPSNCPLLSSLTKKRPSPPANKTNPERLDGNVMFVSL